MRRKRLNWRKMREISTAAGLVGASQVGLFLLLLGYALHEMKSVLIPLILAVLVSLVLYPVFLIFRKIRLPRLMSSALTVSGLTAVLIFGGYQAVIPGFEWARNMDEANVLHRVQEVFRPMQAVQKELSDMAEKVEEATTKPAEPAASKEPPDGDGEGVDGEQSSSSSSSSTSSALNAAGKLPGDGGAEVTPEVVPEEPKAPKPKPVRVEIHEDPLGLFMKEAREFGVGLFAFLLLVLFILAYGKQVMDQLTKDQTAEALPRRIATEIARYLSTITIVNAGLGVFIGAAMWGLGMPKPILWGVMAMVFNFIPYIGALAGTVVIFFAAVVNFEQPTMVIAAPGVYFLLTAIEGNLVTPSVLGGRFSINPLVVFLWIFAWGGFWGVAGILIAMPALVTFKIVCENTDRLSAFRRLLNA